MIRGRGFVLGAVTFLSTHGALAVGWSRWFDPSRRAPGLVPQLEQGCRVHRHYPLDGQRRRRGDRHAYSRDRRHRFCHPPLRRWQGSLEHPLAVPQHERAVFLEPGRDAQDLALAGLGRRAPFQRFFHVRTRGVDDRSKVREDGLGEGLGLLDVGVDAVVGGHGLLGAGHCRADETGPATGRVPSIGAGPPPGARPAETQCDEKNRSEARAAWPSPCGLVQGPHHLLPRRNARGQSEVARAAPTWHAWKGS